MILVVNMFAVCLLATGVSMSTSIPQFPSQGSGILFSLRGWVGYSMHVHYRLKKTEY